VSFEHTEHDAVNAGNADRQARLDSTPASISKRGSNASWLIAYFGGVTVLLMLVAVWEAMA
jgi:hypothetical protein